MENYAAKFPHRFPADLVLMRRPLLHPLQHQRITALDLCEWNVPDIGLEYPVFVGWIPPSENMPPRKSAVSFWLSTT